MSNSTVSMEKLKNKHLLLSAIAAALWKEGRDECQKNPKIHQLLPFYTIPGNIFLGFIRKGFTKYVGYI